LFDHIESVEGISAVVASWSNGLLNKIKCLAQSPYDHTLYLDTDTIVLTSELSSLFRLADSFDVGMAETSIDDSFSHKFFGRPLFNSGVMLYRKNARTTRWLEEWVAGSEPCP
jgi:alpha-N-acetylglucosamine transferase